MTHVNHFQIVRISAAFQRAAERVELTASQAHGWQADCPELGHAPEPEMSLESDSAWDGIDYTGAPGVVPELLGGEDAYHNNGKFGGYERPDMLGYDWQYTELYCETEAEILRLRWVWITAHNRLKAQADRKRYTKPCDKAALQWEVQLTKAITKYGVAIAREQLAKHACEFGAGYPEDDEEPAKITRNSIESWSGSFTDLAPGCIVPDALPVEPSFELCLKRFAKSDDAGKLRGLDAMRPMAPVRTRQWAEYPGWLQEQLNLVDDDGDRAVIIRQAAKAGSIPGMGKLAYVAHKAAQRKRA